MQNQSELSKPPQKYSLSCQDNSFFHLNENSVTLSGDFLKIINIITHVFVNL